MTTTLPYFLAGNYAPVAEELTSHELPVTGAIPPELAGWYLRNGPNPHDAASGHWFFGDGMIHGVRLDRGRAVSYRNRWVRTSTFTHGAETEGPHGEDLTAGPANTHVVRHAGRLLALVESSYPYEITAELETVGSYDFAGRLRTAMTAHPKTCPTTGELHFFGVGRRAPFLTYHRADAAGNLVLTRPIDVPASTMAHDFSMTAKHVVFLDLPVVLTPVPPGSGLMPYRWDETYQARVGVLRRDDAYGEVRWLNVNPCYVFHTVNAYDDADGRIVLHVLRYLRRFDDEQAGHPHAATLWRWTIDLAAGRVHEEQLDDRAGEFPRIDDRKAGLPARRGHVTTTRTGADGQHGAITRYDLHTGATIGSHEFADGRVPGEAAFVPADDTPDGPGWLVSYVYNPATDTSDLVILDAEQLDAKPVATVHLPVRVPFGFHGNWIPDRPTVTG
ncbi:carotenoid oxygenase family protein [Kitasatospora sp. NPDC052896]|uniref:carotenoid oxygenase family protein n=1 Tax=Kitasatospora sp. NPDC052896 TaxID=3364061 RepID=UPI0037C8FA55